MTEAMRIARLQNPVGHVRMVLDTDTFNEVDDQFALAYAVRAAEKGELRLEAVYAAPFTHPAQLSAARGMELSYNEILHVLALLDCPRREDFVFRGSDRYMGDTPCDSPAARDLIRRAMDGSPEDPLYVASIGACTNIASAIRLESAIIDRIVVVWLGGNALYWPNAFEYNLKQDISASRTLFDSGVSLILLPARNVLSHLTTTIPELAFHLEGKSAIGTYLTGIVREYAHGAKVWSKVIWDIAAVGYLLHPEWFESSLQHSPHLTDDYRWAHDRTRHLIRVADTVNRDALYADVFAKLGR